MTDQRRDNSRHIRARRGSEIKAKHWTTEAAVRMLMNNLDAEVAEDPQSLVVYGGIGRAGFDAADVMRQPERAGGVDGHAGDRFLGGQAEQGAGHVHRQRRRQQGREIGRAHV